MSLPQRAEVEELLQCRARAWNARSTTALAGCLAPNSQALADDTRRLRQARDQHVTYASLAYRVRHVEDIVLEHGEPVARLTLTQTAYTVRDTDGTRKVPAQEHHLRLTFRGSPGAWRLAAWNVV